MDEVQITRANYDAAVDEFYKEVVSDQALEFNNINIMMAALELVNRKLFGQRQ